MLIRNIQVNNVVFWGRLPASYVSPDGCVYVSADKSTNGGRGNRSALFGLLSKQQGHDKETGLRSSGETLVLRQFWLILAGKFKRCEITHNALRHRIATNLPP